MILMHVMLIPTARENELLLDIVRAASLLSVKAESKEVPCKYTVAEGS